MTEPMTVEEFENNLLEPSENYFIAKARCIEAYRTLLQNYNALSDMFKQAEAENALQAARIKQLQVAYDSLVGNSEKFKRKIAELEKKFVALKNVKNIEAHNRDLQRKINQLIDDKRKLKKVISKYQKRR